MAPNYRGLSAVRARKLNEVFARHYHFVAPVARGHLYFAHPRPRPLYPREESIRGFAKAIFCSGKKAPGVLVYMLQYMPRLILLSCKDLIVMNIYNGTPTHQDPLKAFSNIRRLSISRSSCILMVLPDTSIEDILGFIDYKNVKYMDVSIGACMDPAYIITVAHHILDVSIGAWIRRRGGIIHVGGVFTGDKGRH